MCSIPAGALEEGQPLFKWIFFSEAPRALLPASCCALVVPATCPQRGLVFQAPSLLWMRKAILLSSVGLKCPPQAWVCSCPKPLLWKAHGARLGPCTSPEPEAPPWPGGGAGRGPRGLQAFRGPSILQLLAGLRGVLSSHGGRFPSACTHGQLMAPGWKGDSVCASQAGDPLSTVSQPEGAAVLTWLWGSGPARPVVLLVPSCCGPGCVLLAR